MSQKKSYDAFDIDGSLFDYGNDDINEIERDLLEFSTVEKDDGTGGSSDGVPSCPKNVLAGIAGTYLLSAKDTADITERLRQTSLNITKEGFDKMSAGATSNLSSSPAEESEDDLSEEYEKSKKDSEIIKDHLRFDEENKAPNASIINKYFQSSYFPPTRRIGMFTDSEQLLTENERLHQHKKKQEMEQTQNKQKHSSPGDVKNVSVGSSRNHYSPKRDKSSTPKQKRGDRNNKNQEEHSHYTTNSMEPAIEFLVTDQYFPGALDDSVMRGFNFNDFGQHPAVVAAAARLPDNDPHNPGLSQLESFDIRCQIEQEQLKNALSPKQQSDRKVEIPKTHQKLDISMKRVAPNLVFEDAIRNSTTALDLNLYVNITPESDLKRAITNLTRAQQMNDYSKKVKAAEAAARAAPPERVEDAAILGARSFRTEKVQTQTTHIPGSKNFKPLELISYIGITRPV